MRFSNFKMKFTLAAIAALGALAHIDVSDVADITNIANAFESSNALDAVFNRAEEDDFNVKAVCDRAVLRKECPPQVCNWCKALKLHKDDEEGGCKTKPHGKKLQSTGRYYCNVDPMAYVCQGKPRDFCETRPECQWCEHPVMGKGCFADKQAVLIEPKGICWGKGKPAAPVKDIE